uniref:Putative secreted protein n=1 Tax=Anopheles darlingi TaxID=43151 RepID=A0A2M4DBK9_ANODA
MPPRFIMISAFCLMNATHCGPLASTSVLDSCSTTDDSLLIDERTNSSSASSSSDCTTVTNSSLPDRRPFLVRLSCVNSCNVSSRSAATVCDEGWFPQRQSKRLNPLASPAPFRLIPAFTGTKHSPRWRPRQSPTKPVTSWLQHLTSIADPVDRRMGLRVTRTLLLYRRLPNRQTQSLSHSKTAFE